MEVTHQDDQREKNSPEDELLEWFRQQLSNVRSSIEISRSDDTLRLMMY